MRVSIGLLFVLLIGFSIQPILGQSTIPRFGVYAEVGSNLAITSGTVSAEHLISSFSRDRVHLYGRVGVGQIHDFFANPSGPGTKLGFSLLTGKRENHFEAEMGLMVGRHIQPDVGYTYLFPMFSLGYRYQRPEGGWLIKGFAGILGVGAGIGYAWPARR